MKTVSFLGALLALPFQQASAFDERTLTAIDQITVGVRDARGPLPRISSCKPRSECHYDKNGELIFWVTEYVESYSPLKKVAVTGYSHLKSIQAQHARTMDALGYKEGMAVVSGRLNISTLLIPYYEASARLFAAWKRMQFACIWAQGSVAADGCSVSLQSFFPKGASEPPRPITQRFPNEILRTRAVLILAGMHRCNQFRAQVEALRPLTLRWKRIQDPDWIGEREEDHLEPDQLPDGFYSRLEPLRAELAKSVEDVEYFEREFPD